MIVMMISQMMKTVESGVKKYFPGEIAAKIGKSGGGRLTASPSHIGKSFQIKFGIGLGVKPRFLCVHQCIKPTRDVNRAGRKKLTNR